MKKLFTASFLGLWLLLSFGCSSTPSGTIKLTDLLEKGDQALGQDVAVIGMAEIRTQLSSFQMFRLFDGGKSIWVVKPESVSMPPQGAKIRVSGVFGKKEFKLVGNVFYIEALKVGIE
jgi:hypothetical protein